MIRVRDLRVEDSSTYSARRLKNTGKCDSKLRWLKNILVYFIYRADEIMV